MTDAKLGDTGPERSAAELARWIEKTGDSLPLLNEATGRRRARPKDAAVLLEWAERAKWFIRLSASKEPARCRALLDEMASLQRVSWSMTASVWGGHVGGLMEKWTEGIYYFVYASRDEEAESCLALLKGSLAVLLQLEQEQDGYELKEVRNWASAAVKFAERHFNPDREDHDALVHEVFRLCSNFPRDVDLQRYSEFFGNAVQERKRQASYPRIDESKTPGYDHDDPSSQTGGAEKPSPMGDDLNTKVKKAKAENLARPNSRPSTHQLATYKALLQNVDLLNPKLPEDERLRRAKRLVKAYGRVRERKPKFHDKHPQLRAAFSIVNSAQYQRRAKRVAAKKLAMG